MIKRFVARLELSSYFPVREKSAWKLMGVIIFSALMLLLIEYFASSYKFGELRKLPDLFGLSSLTGRVAYLLNDHPGYKLNRLCYWATMSSIFYFLLPALFVRFVLREKLSDYGLKIRGMFNAWRIYVLLAVIILPCVFIVSFDAGFQETYPFFMPEHKATLARDMFTWECFYILQFFSLEFFFRGFMVHGTKKQFGIWSVFIMIIPYCMIHFGKPFPEACGSIIAGIILGLLSYRTVSVWMGAMLHVTVAISMDLLSLWHRGLI